MPPRKYQSRVYLMDAAEVPTIPVRMSDMSPVVKTTIDAITANVNSAAYQPVSAFATAAQGAKADAAVVANAPISGSTKTKLTYDAKGLVTTGVNATTADIADSTDRRYVTDVQLARIADDDPYLTNFRDKVTTSNATPVVVRSISIPTNSIVFIDSIITFQETGSRVTGGYIWATLSFSRATGSPVALGSLDILESHNLAGMTVTMSINSNSVDITIKGKAGVNVSWSARTTVDKGNP